MMRCCCQFSNRMPSAQIQCHRDGINDNETENQGVSVVGRRCGVVRRVRVRHMPSGLQPTLPAWTSTTLTHAYPTTAIRLSIGAPHHRRPALLSSARREAASNLATGQHFVRATARSAPRMALT